MTTILIDQQFSEDTFSDLTGSLADILSVNPYQLTEQYGSENIRYQDLFVRRRLDEVNGLLVRALKTDSHKVAKLSSIPDLNELGQDKRNEIRMTLSKAYMMHQIDKKDLKNLDLLRKSIQSENNLFDTYAHGRLMQV